jgi:hypothetical protein
MGESAAEKELRAALSKPLSMHSSLTEFLRRAYGDKALMAAPEDVDWKLYKLYNSPAKAAGLESDVPTLKKFVNQLWSQLASAGGVRGSGFLQGHKIKFAELEQLANGLVDPESKVRFIDRCCDFLYFRVAPGNVAVRLYANVLLEYGPDAMELLASYAAKTKNHGLVDMKIAGPAILKTRSDVIVVYCSSKEAAQAAGAELLKQKSWLGTKCPEMTTPITSGLGLSTGAEPERQVTGMKSDDQISPEAQSFGTIRCELIAMAIHNFNASKGTMGSSFEVFQKFVQVAFLAYGLDPAKPGD